MTAIALRPRVATEIVDAAARLLGQHYLTLITIATVLQLPVAALEIFIGPQTLERGGATYNGGLAALVQVVAGLALTVADGAIILVISDVYLGGAANATSALRRTWQSFRTLVAARIMSSIATVIAATALIVPGIYVATRLATLPAVVMCENNDATTSVSRAWELSEDEVGRIFVPMLLAWIIYYAAVFGLAFGAALLGRSVPVLKESGVTMVLRLLAPILVHPLVAVTSVLVYYDLRVRKEAFDLEILASEIGVRVPQF